MNSYIIQTKGLRRTFKKTVAVDSLDLAIEQGELFGLVGPDGAGKTTTLRLLAGLLDITEGEAEVAYFDLKKDPDAVKAKIGYMAQQFSLYGELSVTENLSFFAELYDIDPNQIQPRMEKMLTFAGLTAFKNRRATHLSGGMQKKLALACTLIHDPEILLLDEPTTGVDPISRREFWNILTDLHLGGTTILVSTPYMDEADRCSRVAMLHQGKVVISGTPLEIREHVHGEVIAFRPDDWEQSYHCVQTLPGVLEVQTYGESIHLLVDDADERIPQVEAVMKEQNLLYHDMHKAPLRMEEAFISLVGKLEEQDVNPSP